MYNFEDETLSAKEEDTGRKIVLTVHGEWSARSILRAVSQIIIERRTGKIEPEKMVKLLYEAENAIVSIYGSQVVIPKPETVETKEACQVADMKADLVKHELKHAKWRAFVLGWTLASFCLLAIRWIFGDV